MTSARGHETVGPPGATGPQDCGLVHLVIQDDDLRAELTRMRAEQRRSTGSGTGYT